MHLPFEEIILYFSNNEGLGEGLDENARVSVYPSRTTAREKTATKNLCPQMCSLERNPFPAKKQTLRAYRVYISLARKASSPLTHVDLM